MGRLKLPYERGDRFETARVIRVPALVHWRAPLTTGFDAELPAGVVVVALKDAEARWQEYPGLPVVPEAYDKWEARLVPKADLALRDGDRGYDGFHLNFSVEDIGDTLRRLEGKSDLLQLW